MSFSKKGEWEMTEKENKANSEEIEVVFGDDSVLNISAVGDCMNDLRPKDSIKNRKKVIIPIAKKKREDKENKEDTENK